MKIIDFDGNGFIEYKEFLRASWDFLKPENVKIVFHLLDINISGSISPNELKKLMGQNADDINEDVWNEIIRAIDLNKDGVISLNEFDKMLDEVRHDKLLNYQPHKLHSKQEKRIYYFISYIILIYIIFFI